MIIGSTWLDQIILPYSLTEVQAFTVDVICQNFFLICRPWRMTWTAGRFISNCGRYLQLRGFVERSFHPEHHSLQAQNNIQHILLFLIQSHNSLVYQRMRVSVCDSVQLYLFSTRDRAMEDKPIGSRQELTYYFGVSTSFTFFRESYFFRLQVLKLAWNHSLETHGALVLMSFTSSRNPSQLGLNPRTLGSRRAPDPEIIEADNTKVY